MAQQRLQMVGRLVASFAVTIVAGLALVGLSFCLGAQPLSAQEAADEPIVIINPKEGASVVNTSVEVSGTSPASTIVTVVITDTDTNRAGIAHQEDGKVEGTVTAASDGHWTYVPQHLLVPGQFSVQASYANRQNRVINSEKVNFVVLNSKGSSVQFSSSLLKRLIAWGGLAAIFIASSVVFFVGRRRKQNLKHISANADAIEAELERTMKQLVRTNAEIAELNERIKKQKKPPGSASSGGLKSG